MDPDTISGLLFDFKAEANHDVEFSGHELCFGHAVFHDEKHKSHLQC